MVFTGTRTCRALGFMQQDHSREPTACNWAGVCDALGQAMESHIFFMPAQRNFTCFLHGLSVSAANG